MPFSFKPSQEGEQSAQVPAPSQPGVTSTPISSIPASMALDTRQGEERGLVEMILIGVLGLVVSITVIFFGYHYYLVSKVESKKAEIASFETKLGALPLDDMRKLSNRLKVINQLVKEHPSVNAAFRILEDSVENPITYKRFDLHYSDALRAYELQLSAIAPSYRAVAEQMDTFKRKPYNKYVPSISVGDIHLDENGAIVFTLKMPIAITGVLPEGLLLQEDSASIAPSTFNPASSLTATTSTATTSVKSNDQFTATSSLIKKP